MNEPGKSGEVVFLTVGWAIDVMPQGVHNPSYHSALLAATKDVEAPFRNTGFFDKTKFSSLSIFLTGVDPNEKPTRAVFFSVIDRGKCLCANFTLSKTEFESAIDNDCISFAVAIATIVMTEACRKYRVENKTLESLIKDYSNIIEFNPKDVIWNIKKPPNELNIFIKLESEFPTSEEHVRNTLLLDQVANRLEAASLGTFVGSEAGAGYESMSFEVKNSRKAFKLISPLLEGLPKGSIVKGTEKDIIEELFKN